MAGQSSDYSVPDLLKGLLCLYLDVKILSLFFQTALHQLVLTSYSTQEGFNKKGCFVVTNANHFLFLLFEIKYQFLASVTDLPCFLVNNHSN